MSKPIPNPIGDLREIRSLMERSRYFIGLSGLSGVGAGLFALLGVGLVVAYQSGGGWGLPFFPFLASVATVVLCGALASGYYFTNRRAASLGQKIRDPKAYKLIFHLAVPLVVGGVFCLAMFYQGYFFLIGPASLIFYGLALLNGSGYAREELSYLAYLEIGLGLVSAFCTGYTIYFWAVGFGFLHIGYGLWMYRKYDRA